MGKTKRRRAYEPTREQKLLRRQWKEKHEMSGIIDLTIGPSYDESVHERWDTGSPSDWRVDSLGDVYDHLMDINDGEERGFDPDDIWDDANLIWDWLQGAKAAREA